MTNSRTAVSGCRVTFVLKDAAVYEVPTEADCFFFFNPFGLHTLKLVLKQMFDSYYRLPRTMRLFFYYPYEQTEAFLTHHDGLIVEERIDCRDLFLEDDDREQIPVLRLQPDYRA